MTKGFTGLIFEMANVDNVATGDVNEQVKVCSGRTLRLRVTTNSNTGLVLASTTLDNGNIVSNGTDIVVLDPSIDTGEFELEFESIDGLSVDYLGKRKIITTQVMLRDYSNSPTYCDAYSCGLRDDGRLGLGEITVNKDTLTKISSDVRWKSLSSGYTYAIALDLNGDLWSWGHNGAGKLGLRDTNTRKSPVKITSDVKWKFIRCGEDFSFGIDENDDLWAWGENENGRLGLGETTGNVHIPTKISGGTKWKCVAAGHDHALGIDSNNDLWSWGNNGSGELGLNDTTSRTSTTKITQILSGLSVIAMPTTLKWKFVECGENSSFAIDFDGNIWAWGQKDVGRLGLGTLSSNVKCPKMISIGVKWKHISSRHVHAVAIDTNDDLWVWGREGWWSFRNRRVYQCIKPL